jgi:hypothetical protein
MPPKPKTGTPVYGQVMEELQQTLATRQRLYVDLEKELGRPVVSFFTSFRYPVMIEDTDADMLEGVLQNTDLTNGLALIISSPGGLGLAAERIINICRSYSGTGEFWAIVPSKAKSAATMVCFGASKFYMGPSSELGPVDPQWTVRDEKGNLKRYSLFNVVESYDQLFQKAVRTKGNLHPYLQQLAPYDNRDIKEFRTLISLAEDIAVRALKTGVMSRKTPAVIKKKIDIFLSPKTTKAHGRPIHRKEASECDLKIESVLARSPMWRLVYELYTRLNILVSTPRAAKCIESREFEFIGSFGKESS